MAKGIRLLLAPRKKRSKSRDKARKYLEGDWKISRPIDDLTEGSLTSASVSSYSTTATMDNNIGPGRILDKLYQFLGRKVEWRILRTSVSSLHPNKILHVLLASIDDDDDDEDDEDDEDDGEYDYVRPWYEESRKTRSVDYYDLQGPLSDVIKTIGRRKGSVAITGLKTLVHQAQ